MVSLRSKTGIQFQCTIQAAMLVPDSGTSQLPPSSGALPIRPIIDKTPFKLPQRHRLEDIYPFLKVKHVAVVLPPEYGVTRDGKMGWSFYFDWNGSGPCASITSENGRNGVAPYPWSGEPGSLTDPAAEIFMGQRRIRGANGVLDHWQNYEVHGYQKFAGIDWRDGTPVDLETMYDPIKGQVRQAILVPERLAGIGQAEQTMLPEEVTDYLSMLVFFPRMENVGIAQQVFGNTPPSFPNTPASYGESYSMGVPKMRDSRVLDISPEVTKYKIATGGLIQQHILRDLMGMGFWAQEPEVLYVFVPISKEEDIRIFGNGTLTSRRGF